MRIFDGNCAWFAPNVPAAHINTWLADGGVQIRDVRKSIVQYYFSNTLDDDTTIELVRRRDKVVYRSSWITDSSLSRTRQPLGAYALQGFSRPVDRGFQSPPSSLRRPQAVLSERKHTPVRSASYYPVSNSNELLVGGSGSPQQQGHHFFSPPSGGGGGGYYSSLSGMRRPKSVAGDHFTHASSQEFMRYRDNASETQSIRSRSSRHSNASSVISSYGRRQQVVNRFIINADRQTRSSILADVADFTPNQHGFVAYKIPKMV
ncbi:hypothetical protein GQ54DRAFT_195783 [Martensiomyces pterosporus]|nr:hypothetical protein GQ54DRAFT_195783 [Martensiomyces pterosporus]